MQATVQGTMQATVQVTPQAELETSIINFCSKPKTREEIQQHVNIKNRDYFRRSYLNPLISAGYLKLTIPDKPKSPKQKYYSTKK